MGAVAPQFGDHHQSLVEQMKTKVANYILFVERSLAPDTQPYEEPTEHRPRPEMQVIANTAGFPKLPPLPSPELPALKHEELVLIVRAFLNMHYRMYILSRSRVKG